MNPRIKQLAEDAGFCFWEDEEWKPHGAIIDWGADYDKEFQKYTELLIKDCISLVQPSVHHEAYPSSYIGGEGGLEILESKVKVIKEHFGIE